MAEHTSDQAPGRKRFFAQADSSGSSPGGIFNPITILPVVLIVVFILWTRRRRQAQEQHLRELRKQETETHAEESARNVAHIMRQAPTRATAEAVATEGLAAAARIPAQPTVVALESPDDQGSENGSAEIEIAERELLSSRDAAAARASEAADLEAADAAHRAGMEGPSDVRRVEAGRAAADEAEADTIDSKRVDTVGPRDADSQSGDIIDPIDAADIVAPEVDVIIQDAPVDAETEARAALRAGLAELESEAAADAPFGSITGDGSATCPPEYPIKGNKQSQIYHEPGQSSYAATIPEFCFASREAAEAAGYRQSRARGGRSHE